MRERFDFVILIMGGASWEWFVIGNTAFNESYCRWIRNNLIVYEFIYVVSETNGLELYGK